MGFDLYKPEYEQTVRARPQHGTSMEQLVNDMGELVVVDPRRMDTFPVRTCYSSESPCRWLIFWNTANAVRLFNAICIDFGALCYLVLILASVSNSGKPSPRHDNF